MIDETEITPAAIALSHLPGRIVKSFHEGLRAAGLIDSAVGTLVLKHPKSTMAMHATGREDAEALAIAALGFVASDAQLMSRFLAITGIEASSIRQAAGEPGFLAGVMQFILAHEPTLMRFAEETGTNPASVGKALRALPTGDADYEAST